jgi:antitoxin CptB
MDIENRPQFIKKLLYQSCNRGCKETDLIIGQFAKLYVKEMNDEELQIFNKILQLTDADIYDWYTRKKTVPTEHKSQLMTQILNFEPSSK